MVESLLKILSDKNMIIPITMGDLFPGTFLFQRLTVNTHGSIRDGF